jgi:unsaturated chondroitin disaccharide hydrolase
MARATALAAAAAALTLSAAAAGFADPMPESFYDAFATAANATLAQLPNASTYPSNGKAGSYGWSTSGYSGWTSGFFPGQLWRLYNRSSTVAPSADAGWWAANAAARTSPLAPEQFDASTHDVGFIVYTSFGAQWHLTGNETARDIAVQTAVTLCSRYSPVVGCLQSWGVHPPPNHEFEVIADNMLNLELLWWAGGATGNETMLAIANSHTQHMMRDLFQPFAPGCVWHLIVYDDRDGSIISRSSTPQGLGNNTVWSRGQAWIVHGFAIAFRFTGNASYLAQAQAAADCFIRLTTACCGNAQYNYAPFWDFNVTAPSISVDTSAMMIAASGIIEIAWHTTDEAQRAAYLAFAKTLLDSVVANYVFTPAANDAVLRNGTVTYPLAGVSIIYADYYAMQAAMRWDATPAAWREAAAELMPLRAA